MWNKVETEMPKYNYSDFNIKPGGIKKTIRVFWKTCAGTWNLLRKELFNNDENDTYEDVYQKKIRDKNHLDLCLNADEEITKLNLKIEYYNTVLDYLSDILKMIHGRTYQIKNSF